MTLNNDSEKDKILKKDFKTAQYIYISLYLGLVITLVVMYS
ncbi:MAG: hypothetical protein ACJ0FB_00945 [Gammaproteobacteria bacterium]|jgi:hypothetical protein